VHIPISFLQQATDSVEAMLTWRIVSCQTLRRSQLLLFLEGGTYATYWSSLPLRKIPAFLWWLLWKIWFCTMRTKNPRSQSAGRWTFKQNSMHSRDICCNLWSTNFKDTQNSAVGLNPQLDPAGEVKGKVCVLWDLQRAEIVPAANWNYGNLTSY